MDELPPPPDNPMSKFMAGDPCAPGGTVVDSAYRHDGYLCCSSCRGFITWNFITGWVHIPR